ncbi:transposase family protein [Corynebacterium belfantii]|nr:transposase family protein [Corynebacterium belfantii]
MISINFLWRVLLPKISFHLNRGCLKQAFDNNAPPDPAKLVIHSDRGCHYRGNSWIQASQDIGFTRSMSKKGCSPDNSACEGLFGRMKK